MPLPKQQFGNDYNGRNYRIIGQIEKLISGQTETTGTSLIDSKVFKVNIHKLVVRSSLLRRQCQDSRLFRLGAVFGENGPIPMNLGRETFNAIQSNFFGRETFNAIQSNFFSKINRIDEKPMGFEWKIFPGFTTAGILNEIHKMMSELQCDSADFKDKINFMLMFNFLDSNGGENVAEFQRFRSPNIPLLQCFGKTKSKGRGETTINFTASDDTVQLLLKMVISVDQLSLYGALADLIKELPDDQRAPRKLVALDQMEQEILIQPPVAEVHANDEGQGNLLQNNERRFEKLPKDQKLSKLCSESGLTLVEVGQFFCALPSPNGTKNQSLCCEYTLLRDENDNCAKGWIESDARFGSVSDIKVCKTIAIYSVQVKVPSLFKDQTTSWIRIVNGVEWYVREAMPIQEEKRASVRPAAKAKPNIETFINDQLELCFGEAEKMNGH